MGVKKPAGKFNPGDYTLKTPWAHEGKSLGKLFAHRVAVFDRGQMTDENKLPRPDYTGNRDNIVTNRPPAFTADARNAWVQAREEAALERLLGGAA